MIVTMRTVSLDTAYFPIPPVPGTEMPLRLRPSSFEPREDSLIPLSGASLECRESMSTLEQVGLERQ